MDKLKDTRWKQRYSQLRKAFNQLQNALKIEAPDDIYRAGIIQFFEMTLELAWKTLKDYLESEQIDVKTPRETIQKAFEIEIIADGHIWIDALQKRNLMAHTYDEDRAREAEELIRSSYFTEISKLVVFFESKL
ncbi:nucleotidyltransferase substrate binding protein, HI0074 family [Saccharicrinis carchari]|uniref:Nucleotidyltransferase substrate binding protein, HI0074 family n=1 Tax=Saccharicrinis carchari TaxID=1168039 RepID=A0A521ALC1_SACCC|nr:nucleotidyltransferase substrate binding protein [Saccharicrinis carchari]SMO35644.1 nucleotidyltransferase substrate binding protein, HI0074 family [Saccharicrinis carchari]